MAGEEGATRADRSEADGDGDGDDSALAEARTMPHLSFEDPPTTEAAWRAWGEALPTTDLTPTAVLVVAPHPDDETLALGAALAGWAAAGIPVSVLAVTDGSGSHPGRPNLAELRTAEQVAALADLGVTTPPVRLHLPDGDVAAHEGEVLTAVADLASTSTTVFAPWEHDAHVDHDACGRAARAGAARRGASVVQLPLWSYRWATPATFAALDVRRLVPSTAALAAKVRAAERFRTQLDPYEGAPIISADVRSHFERPWELAILR